MPAGRSRVVAGALVAATLLTVAACTAAPQPTPLPDAPTTPGPTTPAPPPPAPTSVAPVVLDVSSAEEAAFSSPDGALWCALADDGVFCLRPRGYRGTAPTGAEPCPSWHTEDDLRPNTVHLPLRGRPRWLCMDDQAARPYRGDPATDWQRGFGTWVRVDGEPVAALPHGKALRHGPFSCRSEPGAIACANGASGHAIEVTEGQVTLR